MRRVDEVFSGLVRRRDRSLRAGGRSSKLRVLGYPNESFQIVPPAALVDFTFGRLRALSWVSKQYPRLLPGG